MPEKPTPPEIKPPAPSNEPATPLQESKPKAERRAYDFEIER
jgi:hypothetical protein